MNRTPVTSSNIASIGHDPVENILEVEFANGATYQYSDFDSAAFEAFSSSDSIGKYFHARIRGKFETTKVG